MVEHFDHKESFMPALSPKKRKNPANRLRRAPDAISLLKADHRQVAQWFKQYESARSSDRKRRLAADICAALRVHTTIEEEIFYPAFLMATDDKDMHHEAVVEHAGAKNLLAEIEESGPDDEYFDSKVHVLSEMIKHHVKEEEQPGGMFAEARKAKMNLDGIGARLLERKKELGAAAGKRAA
jgi:Hemerythrin HHE cation binding domain